MVASSSGAARPRLADRGSRDPTGTLGPGALSVISKRPHKLDRSRLAAGGATLAFRGRGRRAEGDPDAGPSPSSDRTRPDARYVAAKNAPDADPLCAKRTGTLSRSSPSSPWSHTRRSIA